MRDLKLPQVLGALAFFAVLSIVLPIAALFTRTNWATLISDISTPAAFDALRLSFLTAGVATVVCLLLGIPLALYLSNNSGVVAGIVRVFVNLPLVMPPLVAGLGLLMLFGRNGILGKPLAALTGITIPFTTPAVVLAQVFVALPFMVIAIEGVLRTISPDFALVAASLGAKPTVVLWRVILPLASSGIIAGTVLTFSRALGEFGATILFAGNRPGITQTMPLAIYTAFNGGGVSDSAALALSVLLLFTALAVIFLTRAWSPKATRRRNGQ